MKTLKMMAAIILLLAVAGNVVAGCKEKGEGCGMNCGMHKNMPVFSDLDGNADGKVNEQEFDEFRAARMAKMAEEGRKMKHMGDMPTFADHDPDGDGFISEDELEAHQAEHHREMWEGAEKHRCDEKHDCKKKHKCKEKHRYGKSKSADES